MYNNPSDPLTYEEVKEVESLNMGNEKLLKDIRRLEEEIGVAKKNRRKSLSPENLNAHASEEYIRQIKALQEDAPIIDLLHQWRLARLQCASYSEIIEEVQTHFVEMKRLHTKLLKLRAN